MTSSQHVGTAALDAERLKLLNEYDTAYAQTADDAVQTEHGVFCEAHFRSFLQQYLPKKYGVTKGHIITPDPGYTGALEEWDIIIYDAIEAPTLAIRRTHDEQKEAGKLSIPVEYVRAVVEVKATFNKVMAKKTTNKLGKLRSFLKPKNSPTAHGQTYLPAGFSAFAVFFETKVKSAKEYTDALGKLAPIWQTDKPLPFSGGLIMRGQHCPQYSARINYVMGPLNSDFTRALSECCEFSEPVPSFEPELLGVSVASMGYGQNEFWSFLIAMVHALNGDDDDLPGLYPTKFIGGYGLRSGISPNIRLFPLK